jgi:membrane associated rhomboid family serine protease
MIPIRDLNPTRHVPFLTITFISFNIVVFLFTLTLSGEARDQLSCSAGLIPCQLTGTCPELSARLPRFIYLCLASSSSGPPVALDLITAMFLHGGWIHLLGNMLYLWIFGNNIEDVLGPIRFFLFYMLCGILASLAQVAADPDGLIPTIGASGAIAGVLGAYLVLFPRARVQSLVLVFYFIRFVEIPAVIVLGFWFVLQFFYGLASLGMQGMGGIAFFAHIGGFVAGMGLIYLFRIGQRPGPPHRRLPRRRNIFQDEFPDLWE